MQQKYIKLFTLIILFSLCLFSLLRFILAFPIILNREVRVDGNVFVKPDYVQHFDGNYDNKIITYKFDLNINKFSYKSFNLVADDCLLNLSINTKDIDLSVFSKKDLCNIEKGINIDLSSYVQEENNKIVANIHNIGGGYRFEIKQDNYNIDYNVNFIFFVFTYIVFFAYLAYVFKFDKYKIIALISSILLCFVYLSYTHWYDRSHDVHGHLPYIDYLIEHSSIPSADKCWECHQKPVYYYFSAFSKIAIGQIDTLGYSGYFKFLQIQSIAFYTLFVFIGIYLLRKLSNVYIFLFALWPSGILHSVRIGNDIILYLSIILYIYLILKLWNSRSISKLFFLALGVYTVCITGVKTTAIILPFITLIVYFIKTYDVSVFTLKNVIKYLIRNFTYFLIISVTIFLALLPLIIEKFDVTPNKPGDSMLVGNNISNYLYFDIPIYLKTPNMSTWDNSYGREYFLNLFIKSSLVGEFSIEEYKHKQLAFILSYVLLIFLIIILWSIFKKLKRIQTFADIKIISNIKSSKYLPIILTSISLIIVTMGFRFLNPYSPNQDFRYAYPCILGFIICLNYCVENIKNEFRRKIMHILMYLFIIATILFIILPVFTGLY